MSRVLRFPVQHLLLAFVLGGASFTTAPRNDAFAQAIPERPANSQATLQAYPVPAEQLAAMVNRLQAQYAAQAEVRIAADARTSQILLFAPPQVHLEIEQQLRELAAPQQPTPATPQPAPAAQPMVPHPAPSQAGPPQAAPPQMAPAPSPAAQAAASHPPRREVRPLRNVSWREFEQSLLQYQHLAVPEGLERNGEVAVFRIRSREQAPARMQIDRRTDQVVIDGPGDAVAAWMSLINAFDQRPAADQNLQIVPVQRAEPRDVHKMLAVLKSQQGGAAARIPAARIATMQLAQNQPPQNQPAQNQPAQPPMGNQPMAPAGEADAPEAEGGEELVGGLIGPVQLEFVEGLDVIIVRGNPQDVARVNQLIAELEQISGETQPIIEVHQLEHVDSVALLEIIAQVYDQVPTLRQTRVSLTPLGKPNAVLLIGREDGVDTMLELIDRLDQPVDPSTQFQVFYLKHSAAADAQTTLQTFFEERPGLGTRVRVTADIRSNSLLVQASPRDLAEVAALLKRIDTPTSAAVNELRVFPLQNSLATDLAPILQQAVTGQAGPGAPPAPAAQAGAAATKSMMLRFMTIDAQGQRQIRSGILSDVSITADPRGNALVISAPAESMDLLAALVQQLDQMPAAEAQIKVFTIVNGDALSLVQMLETLFGVAGGAQPGGQVPGQPAFSAAGGEGSLVPIRFSVDQRTNSIIAAGSVAELNVVEAILLRLDASDVRERQSVVYRLKNAPALDVAAAINQFLTSERQVQLFVPGLVSPFEQIEREVVVVPEIVSNSLIVSATPRYFDEIRQIVEQLDARPPLVVIQVLLAEVTMNNTDEFGIEIGLQDSVLFDRSVLQTVSTGGGTQLVPGFNFNNQPLGNSGSPAALANSNIVGTQGLTNFSVGRINPELGFGGLVLSASSESVSVLLRALNEYRKVEVLARPQITTLDNQPAFIQAGQRVPRVTATNITQVGQVNSITLENVGLILGVTPRISPDGLVVMEIDAERSELSSQEGVPISIAPNGDVLRSPIVNTNTAQTTVSALSGQTIVLGGLITKNRSSVHRRVPVLSDIPVLGNLFRYDSVQQRRTELLIIMTPRVIRSELDADIVKQVESSRMSWCLADVVKVHGPSGLRSRSDEWTDGEVPTVYPDVDPQGMLPEGELLLEPPFEPGSVVVPPGAQFAPPGPVLEGPQMGPPLGPPVEAVPAPQPTPEQSGQYRAGHAPRQLQPALYMEHDSQINRSSYQTAVPAHRITTLPPLEAGGGAYVPPQR